MDNNNNEIFESMIKIEDYPDFLLEDKSKEFTNIPIQSLLSLGVTFEPLVEKLSSFTRSGKGLSGYYKADIPKGTHLAFSKKKKAFIGNALKSNNQVGGGVASLTKTNMNPVVFNPAMMMVAVALIGIDQKLAKIEEITKEIMVFLELKEKSKQRGNLEILNDIQKNYKFNWDNEKYKTNKHIQVQEIKREAEQNIIFYRDLINKDISKQNLIHLGQNVKEMSIKAQSNLKEIQLSLYLFAFSSFLEVMLLENYDSAYLKSVSDKIDKYSFNYRELYTECYNQIEKYSKSSVDSHVLKGLAFVNKVAGEAVAKVPGVGKTQADETLIDAGQRLGKFNDKLTQHMMEQFSSTKNNFVRPFIENIALLDTLNNKPIELIFDNNNIHVRMA